MWSVPQGAKSASACEPQAQHQLSITSSSTADSSTKPGQSVKGFLLKEAEITQTLTRSWAVLATLSGQDEHTDDVLDVASQVVHLIPHDSPGHRPGTPGRAKDAETILPRISDLTFNELLLSSPCSLTMDISFPLDLFITKGDMDVYSAINAYLLAIRRAHLHLGHLWRQSSIRRVHPCPPGYQFSNSSHGKKLLAKQRHRMAERTRAMRKVWATCAAAVFFLAESEAYFQGAVVQESYEHFLTWVEGGQEGSTESLPSAATTNDAQSSPEVRPRQEHDPEALAHAHHHFLSSITYSLLLTDISFPKLLRTFCTHADSLVAYITRLTSIQASLDLEDDEGIEEFSQNYKKEEKEVLLELDRARRRLDSDLKGLVERLREIDSERIGVEGLRLGGKGMGGEGAYEPVRVGGIDRLLMKLDWGGEDEEGEVGDLLR